MSREIDLTKRLTEDELKYLVDRDMWDALRENARNLDLPEPNLPSARGLRKQIPRRQLRHSGAFSEIAKDMGVELSESEDPTTPSVPQPSAQGAEGSEEVPVDYTKLTVPQLKEELDKRRADYEADGDTEAVAEVSYTKEDLKDDLVAKLQLDDEAAADDEAGS